MSVLLLMTARRWVRMHFLFLLFHENMLCNGVNIPFYYRVGLYYLMSCETLNLPCFCGVDVDIAAENCSLFYVFFFSRHCLRQRSCLEVLWYPASVCLFVWLPPGYLKKLSTDLNQISWSCRFSVKDERIRFLDWSVFGSGSWMDFNTFPTRRDRAFLRASAMLKHVIAIGLTSVRPSVRHTLAPYQNGWIYCHAFFTTR